MFYSIWIAGNINPSVTGGGWGMKKTSNISCSGDNSTDISSLNPIHYIAVRFRELRDCFTVRTKERLWMAKAEGLAFKAPMFTFVHHCRRDKHSETFDSSDEGKDDGSLFLLSKILFHVQKFDDFFRGNLIACSTVVCASNPWFSFKVNRTVGLRVHFQIKITSGELVHLTSLQNCTAANPSPVSHRFQIVFECMIDLYRNVVFVCWEPLVIHNTIE